MKCLNACKLSKDKSYCTGCGRTLEQIKAAYEKQLARKAILQK